MNGPVDSEVKKEMYKSLSAFERIAKKAMSKYAKSPYLHESTNYGNNQNMLTEDYSQSQMTNYQPTQQPSYMPPTNKSFSVFAIPNASGKMRYDVANQNTGEKLVGSLALSECANGIAKLMNKGYSFYSPQIKSLLEFEQNYQKYYNDALTFKKKIADNPHRDQIVETRFEESKLKAQETKRRLVEFVTRL